MIPVFVYSSHQEHFRQLFSPPPPKIQIVLTSMTPSVLRFMSSVLMLCVLLCNRLATSLTTLSRVLPTGGSSTPHVVFIMFLC